jgi:hypothetical protein
MPALLPHMGLSYPVSIEIWMTPQDLEPSPYIMRRRGTGEDKVLTTYHESNSGQDLWQM